MTTSTSKPEKRTFTLTEQERSTVLNGLINELMDAKRYVSGYDVPDEPSETDRCCAAHLARYEQRKKELSSLRARLSHVKNLVKMFEASA